MKDKLSGIAQKIDQSIQNPFRKWKSVELSSWKSRAIEIEVLSKSKHQPSRHQRYTSGGSH